MKIKKRNTYPPNEKTLRKNVIEYLKNCQPNYYRYLKKSSGLEDHVKNTMDRTKDYANELINTGMVQSEAWQMAIRVSTNVVAISEPKIPGKQVTKGISKDLVFASIAFFALVAIETLLLIIQTADENNKTTLINSAIVLFVVSAGACIIGALDSTQE